MFLLLLVSLTAGVAAYRMAWTQQHKKLAGVGILMCSFGVLQTVMQALARSFGL
jgi:hypothetical protein